MAKVLSSAIFKLVNLFALLGYLFNIISMFADGNSYCGSDYYETITYLEYDGPYSIPRSFRPQPVKTTDASSIVNGVFHIFSFLALLYIEVDQSPVISRVVPFMFSFAGRGVFFIWLAWTTFRVSIISIIGSIFTFIVGIIYVFLFVLKNMKTPQHMSYDETLFAGVSKYFTDSDEGESFLPMHKSDASDNNRDIAPTNDIVV